MPWIRAGPCTPIRVYSFGLECHQMVLVFPLSCNLGLKARSISTNRNLRESRWRQKRGVTSVCAIFLFEFIKLLEMSHLSIGPCVSVANHTRSVGPNLLCYNPTNNSCEQHCNKIHVARTPTQVSFVPSLAFTDRNLN